MRTMNAERSDYGSYLHYDAEDEEEDEEDFSFFHNHANEDGDDDDKEENFSFFRDHANEDGDDDDEEENFIFFHNHTNEDGDDVEENFSFFHDHANEDGDDDEEEDDGANTFYVHPHSGGEHDDEEDDDDNDDDYDDDDDSDIFSSDEAYARALQEAEEGEMAARLMALAGLNDRRVMEVEDHGGNVQVAHPPAFLRNPRTPPVQENTPPSTEDLELAMAINASIQSATAVAPIFNGLSAAEASASTSRNNTVNLRSEGIPAPGAPMPPLPPEGTSSGRPVAEAPPGAGQAIDPAPSVPPAGDEIVEDSPIHHPSIDSSTVDIENSKAATSGEKKGGDGGSSSCVICLDAPVEGACIPCGHMAGCMSCLNEIKAKKWGCPVCRAKIDQVIRLYAV